MPSNTTINDLTITFLSLKFRDIHFLQFRLDFASLSLRFLLGFRESNSLVSWYNPARDWFRLAAPWYFHAAWVKADLSSCSIILVDQVGGRGEVRWLLWSWWPFEAVGRFPRLGRCPNLSRYLSFQTGPAEKWTVTSLFSEWCLRGQQRRKQPRPAATDRLWRSHKAWRVFL